MNEKLTIPYDVNKGELYYVEEYKKLGYRIHEVQNIDKGNFIVFGPLTDYHSIENDEWVFDKEKWIEEVVRVERNKRLKDTDYLMIQDVNEKLNNDEIEKWKDYRQKLRDFTNNLEYDEDLKWPEKPKS